MSTITKPSCPSDVKSIGRYVIDGFLEDEGGEGSSCALIRRGHCKHDPRAMVVVKEMMKGTNKSKELARREAQSMGSFDHPHVMPLLDSVEKGDRLYIVMPYLSGGDLFDSICGSALPSVSRCRTVFAQLVSAVDYMHSIGFVHLDIKPDNIMLDEYNNIRLGDLGHCKQYSKLRPLIPARPGTAEYTAPEALFERACGKWRNARQVFGQLGIECNGTTPMVYGPEMDVWAMGCSLFVMLTGYFPFGGNDWDELIQSVLMTTPEFPFHIPPECVALLQGMLEKDPARRATLADIRRSDWLAREVEMVEAAHRAGMTREISRMASEGVPSPVFPEPTVCMEMNVSPSTRLHSCNDSMDVECPGVGAVTLDPLDPIEEEAAAVHSMDYYYSMGSKMDFSPSDSVGGWESGTSYSPSSWSVVGDPSSGSAGWYDSSVEQSTSSNTGVWGKLLTVIRRARS